MATLAQPDPPPHAEPHHGRHPRRLTAISLLPAAATLGNLLCGFLVLFCCLLAVRATFASQTPLLHPWMQLFPSHLAAGAYLIFLAMIFDALDGRLARITRRTSEFGAQLDSLADIVSFGVAPAALLVTMQLLLRPVPSEPPEPDLHRLQFRVGMACALVYVSCAGIRLARFNVENVRSEAGQKAFSGLPSPGAAAAIASLLALHENLRSTGYALWGVDWADVSRWLISGTALVVGFLMVSRLDYMHVFNVYIRRKHPPTHLLWPILVLGIAWYNFELLLVVLALAYVISGVVLHLRRRPAAGSPPPPSLRTLP